MRIITVIEGRQGHSTSQQIQIHYEGGHLQNKPPTPTDLTTISHRSVKENTTNRTREQPRQSFDSSYLKKTTPERKTDVWRLSRQFSYLQPPHRYLIGSTVSQTVFQGTELQKTTRAFQLLTYIDVPSSNWNLDKHLELTGNSLALDR